MLIKSKDKIEQYNKSRIYHMWILNKNNKDKEIRYIGSIVRSFIKRQMKRSTGIMQKRRNTHCQNIPPIIQIKPLWEKLNGIHPSGTVGWPVTLEHGWSLIVGGRVRIPARHVWWFESHLKPLVPSPDSLSSCLVHIK